MLPGLCHGNITTGCEFGLLLLQHQNEKNKKKKQILVSPVGFDVGLGGLSQLPPPKGSVPAEVLSGLSRPKTPQAHPKARSLQPICPMGGEINHLIHPPATQMRRAGRTRGLAALGRWVMDAACPKQHPKT